MQCVEIIKASFTHCCHLFWRSASQNSSPEQFGRDSSQDCHYYVDAKCGGRFFLTTFYLFNVFFLHLHNLPFLGHRLSAHNVLAWSDRIGGETSLKIDQKHNIHLVAALPAYKFELPCGGKYAEIENDISLSIFQSPYHWVVLDHWVIEMLRKMECFVNIFNNFIKIILKLICKKFNLSFIYWPLWK